MLFLVTMDMNLLHETHFARKPICIIECIVMIQKIAPKKLTNANITKYYLLTLKLSLSRQKGRDNLLVQKRGMKYVM